MSRRRGKRKNGHEVGEGKENTKRETGKRSWMMHVEVVQGTFITLDEGNWQTGEDSEV